jgi:hypothetical protein
MAAVIECRLARERSGSSAKRTGTGNESQDNDRFRFPVLAPYETAIVETVS